MPELPEVQTIVSELDKKIKGKKISKADVKIPKMTNLPVLEFEKKVKNKTVKSVWRRAKMIIIDLEGKGYLLIHLKMTGQLVFVPKAGRVVSGGHPIASTIDLPNKFSHFIFYFSDGSKLFFNDIRKFGWIRYADKELMEKETGKYGAEPLTDDFTFKYFNDVLNRYPRRNIKQILMDQSLIAGIGNIYADESCFNSQILPIRISNTLTEVERKKLFKAIPKILKLAIEKGGTTADTYIRTDGSKGSMFNYLNVYGQQGKICKTKKCQGTVNKIRLNGRGTYFCAGCQK
ncbi:MAG: bifunctional DNA-formamidopyrimidine glycosylase/DNA-(apurinic or apyrimidinic site) lyase [Candidatus Buchananbacteria bacterium]